MQEVASGTREQSAGIEQIDNAIHQMDNSTRQNALLVEQSRSAAAALEDQAEQMKQRVESFRISQPVRSDADDNAYDNDVEPAPVTRQRRFAAA